MVENKDSYTPREVSEITGYVSALSNSIEEAKTYRGSRVEGNYLMETGRALIALKENVPENVKGTLTDLIRNAENQISRLPPEERKRLVEPTPS